MNPAQWTGLLNWSTKYHDGTYPSQSQLSDDEKKWLSEALAQLVVDESKRVVELVDALKEEEAKEEIDEDRVADVSEEMQDILCQIDRAKDFHRVGKLAEMATFLRSKHAALRRVACETIATCAQHNPTIVDSC